MIVRALDTQGDWLFGKGKNDYKTKNPAIAQCVQTGVLSFLGNCFFDMSKGIDWFTYLGGSKDQSIVSLAVATTIINVNGGQSVTGVKRLSISLDSITRVFRVSYQAQTIYSTIADTFSYDANGLV
jgi:hypothetical protein